MAEQWLSAPRAWNAAGWRRLAASVRRWDAQPIGDIAEREARLATTLNVLGFDSAPLRGGAGAAGP